MAYSRTGSLSQSEDVAQETFVAAWKQLGNLREPEKLRPWLCGIARNLAFDLLKKQGREPSHGAETLDALHEAPATEPWSYDRAVSNEEAALLWDSLKRLPEQYREPLVLFYREQKSVEAVARHLDLSEDAVKQRLSRGRRLLHKQVLGFVEGALKHTGPTKTFTLGVLAALSFAATPAKAAAVGVAAAKVGGATKAGASWGLLTGLLPALASLGFTLKSSLEDAKSPRERRFAILAFGVLILSLAIVYSLLVWFLFFGPVVHDKFVAAAALLFIPLTVAFPLAWFTKVRRRQIQMEDAPEEVDPVSPANHGIVDPSRQSSKARMYLYLGMACNMGGLTFMLFTNAWQGKAGYLLFSGIALADTLFLGACAWRNRPRQSGKHKANPSLPPQT
jgi:RNA polymerase sigma factor (sigma-70 family)